MVQDIQATNVKNLKNVLGEASCGKGFGCALSVQWYLGGGTEENCVSGEECRDNGVNGSEIRVLVRR